ncbi:MAG: MBL fold metallo-hydrolase [Chloroflexota bacterium]
MLKQKFVMVAFLLIVSLMVTQTVGFAAPPQQSGGEDYTVQADDWLSKIADKTYGDLLVFPAIVTATNQKAATDDSYARITNPDLIEVGQKLYLPSANDVEGLLADGSSLTRESGLTVTVQDVDGVVVHSLTAPEQVFANSTHIIETANSLVLIDTQFLLPNALDYRVYADSLGKPIERLIITHEHPDHFLGSEAFADVDIYALAEVSDAIAAIGQAEVDEKQADFGDAIASTFVVPTVLEPGAIEIDGVTFEFELVRDAEAEIQVVTKLPDYGVVSVGDIVYSGVHLILAGPPPTWTEALENLKAESADYPIVLAGHGFPGGPSLYDENIAWLAKAGELLGTATSGADFKAGLVDAFPSLGMDAAIDFVTPFLFPDDTAEAEVGRLLEVITVELASDATAEDFLTANQAIQADYASQQPGYLSRETGVSEEGQWRIAVQWEAKADSDASIAGFGEAPGLEDFMTTLNPETMVVTQYELKSGADQSTFSGAGVVEVITLRLKDGADVDGFVAANKVIRDEYASLQPGFIARQTGVTADGEWALVVHWESKADAEASIAGFGEATGLEEFSSFIDFETMVNTIYEIQ